METYQQISQLILENLQTGGDPSITAEEHREVEKALLDFARDQWLAGDIKEIDCTNQYIADNFENNGFGRGERVGWAICNGFNGTINLTGRVCVGYGNNPSNNLVKPFPSMGTGSGTTFAPTIGGNKDAAVVDHTHPFTNITGNREDESGKTQIVKPKDGILTTGNASGGVPATDKNMQPYIVTLFIQKL